MIGAASVALARPAYSHGVGHRAGSVVSSAAPTTSRIGANYPVGRDFPTPETWIASLPSVIPYNASAPVSYTGVMYNDANPAFTTTGIVIPSSIDTSQWNGTGLPAIIFTVASGNDFRSSVRSNPLTYNPAYGVAISCPNASLNGSAILSQVQNISFRNFQIQCNNGNRVLTLDVIGAGSVDVRNLIVNSHIDNFIHTGQNTTVTNCLFEMTAPTAPADGTAPIADGIISIGGAVFNFCSIVQASDTTPTLYCIYNTVGEGGLPVPIKNCAIFGCASVQLYEFGSTNAIGSAVTCMSDSPVTLPTGVTLKTYAAALFTGTTNASGLDFRVNSGSPLIGAGTSLSGVTDDISGKTRPASPAIGCWEP